MPRAALAETATKLHEDIEHACSSIPASSRAYLRPLYVLGELHAGLLQQIARMQLRRRFGANRAWPDSQAMGGVASRSAR